MSILRNQQGGENLRRQKDIKTYIFSYYLITTVLIFALPACRMLLRLFPSYMRLVCRLYVVLEA